LTDGGFEVYARMGKSLSLRHKNRWYTDGVLPIFISMRLEGFVFYAIFLPTRTLIHNIIPQIRADFHSFYYIMITKNNR